MGLNDTKPFLNDWGVPVERSVTSADGSEETQSTKGIFSEPTRTLDFSGVSVISNDLTLEYPTDGLPGLKEQDRILVAGRAYAVRELSSVDDGVFSVAKLRKLD
jgi:hypothetical protein